MNGADIMTPDIRIRVEDLEARSAHQERTIEELSEMITAQWRQIDLLTRQLERMKVQFTELSEARPPMAPEPPPPHY
jgi:SlyX protein